MKTLERLRRLGRGKPQPRPSGVKRKDAPSEDKAKKLPENKGR